MRLHHPLDDLLTGTASLRALRVLARGPPGEFTGGDLAHRARVSPSQAWTVLRVLEREGIVRSRVMGRTHLWRVEPRNVLLQALGKLLELEQALPHEVDREIERALRPTRARRAVVFGSFVRGEERPDLESVEGTPQALS